MAGPSGSGCCSPACSATSSTGCFRDPGPFRGHVVDFFALPNWPVFNVADICIDVAAGFFVILLLRGIRLDGSRHEEHPRDES